MNEELDQDLVRTTEFLAAAHAWAQTADVLIAEHRRELDRIAAILATFAASMSMGDLKSVMELAAELLPRLVNLGPAENGRKTKSDHDSLTVWCHLCSITGVNTPASQRIPIDVCAKHALEHEKADD